MAQQHLEDVVARRHNRMPALLRPGAFTGLGSCAIEA